MSQATGSGLSLDTDYIYFFFFIEFPQLQTTAGQCALNVGIRKMVDIIYEDIDAFMQNRGRSAI